MVLQIIQFRYLPTAANEICLGIVISNCMFILICFLTEISDYREEKNRETHLKNLSEDKNLRLERESFENLKIQYAELVEKLMKTNSNSSSHENTPPESELPKVGT